MSITFSIRMFDSEHPPQWASYCTSLTPANQDSGGVWFYVQTGDPAALLKAVAADPDVLDWMPSGSSIRLNPALCDDLIDALHGIEFGDVEDFYPPEEQEAKRDSWEASREDFDGAIQGAVQSIHPDPGIIDGQALADALASMDAAEAPWGDIPSTRLAMLVIAKHLDWSVPDYLTPHKLAEMLRAGES